MSKPTLPSYRASGMYFGRATSRRSRSRPLVKAVSLGVFFAVVAYGAAKILLPMLTFGIDGGTPR